MAMHVSKCYDEVLLDHATDLEEHKKVDEKVVPTAMHEHGSEKTVVLLVPLFQKRKVHDFQKNSLVAQCLPRDEGGHDADNGGYIHFVRLLNGHVQVATLSCSLILGP